LITVTRTVGFLLQRESWRGHCQEFQRLHREKNVIARHGPTILLLLVTMSEALIIAVLLLQRARRRRADDHQARLQQQGAEALHGNELALRARSDELRDLAGRLIAAQEAERTRIARDLHDDLGQKLAVIAMGLDHLALRDGRHQGPKPAELKEQVDRLANDLHRLSHALHPSQLHVLGLVDAIDGCSREMSSQGNLAIEFTHVHVPAIVAPEISLCLYRIVQEALSNIVRHSGARAASITLSGNSEHIALQVTDGGKGFSPDPANEGLGLVSMRERVRYLGGRLELGSSPNLGTTISVRIPLHASNPQATARYIA